MESTLFVAQTILAEVSARKNVTGSVHAGRVRFTGHGPLGGFGTLLGRLDDIPFRVDRHVYGAEVSTQVFRK